MDGKSILLESGQTVSYHPEPVIVQPKPTRVINPGNSSLPPGEDGYVPLSPDSSLSIGGLARALSTIPMTIPNPQSEVTDQAHLNFDFI